MDTQKRIKWGIIGCGNIAHKFARDLSLIPEAELTAVASKNSKRAKDFQVEHNAGKGYNSYEELLQDKDIDIVYIAIPHSSHARWSIAAMEHQKHVLCEKPLSLNKKEASEIINTSKRTGKFFMEALWTRFNPTLIAVKKHIDNGDLGKIKFINSMFSFKADKPVNSRVYDLSLGGGAILDIGIYPAFLTYTLLGVPEDIGARSIFHKITGCDIQTSMIFQYKNSQAVLYCGFTSGRNIEGMISGTDAEIHFHHPMHAPGGYTLIKDDKEQSFDLPLNGAGFTYEIEECHSCIKKGLHESSLWSHKNSLDLIGILDRVRDEVGLVYPQEESPDK